MPRLLPFPPARRGRGELIQANVGTNPLVKAGPDPIICSAKEHVPRHTKPSRKTRTAHLSSLTKTPGSALPAPGSTDSGHHTLAEQAERAGRRNLPRVSSLLGAGEEAAGTFRSPGRGELRAPSYNSPRHKQGENQTQALPRGGGEAAHGRCKVHPGGRTRDRQTYNTVQGGRKAQGHP